MKKSIILMFAAVVALSAVSCVKEEFEAPVSGTRHTFTCSIEGLTRTSLTDEGKTVWNENDSVRIIAGAKDTIVVVPAEADGQKSFTFDASFLGTENQFYAVYPISVAASVADGKMKITIPSTQDGTFASANIAAASCEGYQFNFKNVTGVLKFTVPEDMPLEVKSVAFTASNVIAGQISVDFSGDSPVVTPLGTGKSILVNVDALPGDYYAAAVPGEYAKGFSLTAVGTDFAYQKKELQGSKTLSRNEIAYLGVIGDKLRALWGDGSEENPWKISSLPEWLAFAYFVNGGNDMEGQYVKVTKPISGINAPVGTYNDIEKDMAYFKGIFDGNDQPLTIETSGDGYQALIGALGPGGQVKNVKVSGTVNSAAAYAAGVVAYVEADTTETVIENCVNDVVVNGTSYVGGIVGYTHANANKITVKDCKNNAAVKGGAIVGGVAGYATQTTISDCENTGAVTSTSACGQIRTLPDGYYRYTNLDGTGGSNEGSVRRATGGVAGVLHNATVQDSNNSGAVTGVSKAGGVAGCLYWSTVANCENSGAVTVTEDLAGGIAGCIWTQGTITDCVNKGTVKARGGVGGLLGVASATERNSGSAYLTVTKSVNEGEVVSNGKTSTSEYNYGMGNLSAAGGIVGVIKHFNRDWTNVTACVNKGAVTGEGQAVGGIVGYQGCPRNGADWGAIDKCVNEGAVTSKLYRAGGILGVSLSRYTTARYTIRNCINKGTVSAPIVAGGIAGWMRVAYPAASAPGFQKIHNCLNTGDVIYTTKDSTAIKAAYAGGLIGFSVENQVYNNVSIGEVKGTNGTDLDVSGYVGTLAGQLSNWSYLSYGYAAYLEDAIFNGTVLGTSVTVSNLAMFDEGQLDVPVTVDGSEYEALLDALNAWVLYMNTDKDGNVGSTYVEWVEGEKCPEPKLVEE
ncbi:MAG: hypothetical protein K6F25_03705 [Bacteroidales bacterium]|nr:hypothetical protein [Bacteroidales bacterium]